MGVVVPDRGLPHACSPRPTLPSPTASPTRTLAPALAPPRGHRGRRPRADPRRGPAPARRRPGRPGAIAPSAETPRPAQPVGRGGVTAAMRAEIDRVVAAGARPSTAGGPHGAAGPPRGARPSRASATASASAGPTSRRRRLAARLADAARRLAPRAHRRPRRRRRSGPRPAAVTSTAAHEGGARRADRGGPVGRQGLDAAPRDPGRAAARRLRREPPRGQAGSRPAGLRRVYPKRRRSSQQGAPSQNRTYWCGPATMQAIGWGSPKKRTSQTVWARRLRTSRPAPRSPTWCAWSTTTPTTTARSTPAPTSRSTSATSPSSSGTA